MTVKALRRQLMAAIAMVVVSVVALSSSTYAWFASNNKVTATGMQVQASAEGGIEIAYAVSTDTGSAYSTSATAGMSGPTELLPTSTIGTAVDGKITAPWYHASAEVASASTAKSGSYTVLTLDAEGKSGTDYYYLVKSFNIRSVSANEKAKDLKVSQVTVTGASNVLSQSLRVAVVCGNNTVIYAPYGYDADVKYKVATAVDSNGNATMPGDTNVTALFATEKSGVIANEVATKGATNNGGTDVNVYIYFEGEDSNHFSNNITATLDTISLTVEFEATIG